MRRVGRVGQGLPTGGNNLEPINTLFRDPRILTRGVHFPFVGFLS